MSLEDDLLIIHETAVVLPFASRSSVTQKPAEEKATAADRDGDQGRGDLEQADRSSAHEKCSTMYRPHSLQLLDGDCSLRGHLGWGKPTGSARMLVNERLASVPFEPE